MISDNADHTGDGNTSSESLAEDAQQQASVSAIPQPDSVPISVPEITRDQLSLSKRLLNWRTLIPLIIVIVALVYFAQKANINPARTWEAMKSANLFFFLAAFAIYYLSFGIRAWRWRLLLENVGYRREQGVLLPGFWKFVEIIFISFFANVVVPAKLGDLYRAYLLRQQVNVSGTRSFGTVLSERLLDLIILLLLFIPAIIVSLHEHLPPQLQLSLELLLGAVVLGILGLFVLRQAREPIARLIPTRFRGQYYHFQEGTLGSFRRLPILILLTVGVWLCESLRFFFVAVSLHLIGGSILHITAAAVVIGLAEALLTIVPATGGGLGVVEIGMIPIIGLFYTGPNAVNLSTAAILLDRTISLFSVLVFGGIVFLIAFGRQTTTKPKKIYLDNMDRA
ncbi:lysylphosphatidylglycerol synthase transmembrane domain-containing protein [Ktedonobacter robiniae]|uniref:TIGR00374 family protein n=1 Tax=Ktedonobacter robiniae TaxID=2778365 RepID=A0ABQ3UIF4_9CHLR|nr:lysylphosphatidylglycerol synthase transmembrane domain-containing protein [Ktedonobacter robiniae]GHO52195.1 TIGR00374 family protein [Ktedonobacter robiniae]